MPNKSENCRKFDSKKHLCKTLMSQKCTYTLRIDQSRSESVEKCSVFKDFECSHYTVFQMLVRIPFSKSTVFNICPQKKCRFYVNTGGLSVTFHHFQNVPASRESGLRLFRRIVRRSIFKKMKLYRRIQMQRKTR